MNFPRNSHRERMKQMSSLPHYFFGISVAEHIQSWLSNWQDELRGQVAYKTWTNPKDLHITLKFLGATPSEKIEALSSHLYVKEYVPFQLEIGDLGFFGKRTQPRVMWAEVKKTDTLQMLYNIIEETAFQHSFSKENRPYTPHITLAKKWSDDQLHIDPNNMKAFIPEMNKQRMQVEQFHLYRIFPSRQVKYEPVHTFKLK